MTVESLFPLSTSWEVATLGDVCRRGGGDVQTGPFGSQLHAADYVPVGIPSIMPMNIGDNRISEEGIARITPEDARRLSKYLVRTGDIVYSRRGDVERRALVREPEDGWLCGTGCLRVRFGEKSVVHPPYAAYYLGHPSVREWIVRHAQGATMPNLNTSILSALPFVLPSIEEQEQVASVLTALDDKIELNRQINQTLEQIAQTIFKSWFIDFEPVKAKIEAKAAGRDPERAAMCAISGKLEPELDQLPPEQYQQLAATAALFPDALVESELGLIPVGWEVKSLDQVANYLNGLALQKFPPESETDWLPVIKIAQLKKGDTEGADRASSKLKPVYIVDDGDVLFSWSGSLTVDIWTGGQGALNQHLFKVTSVNYPKWFYLHWTKFHLARFQNIAADKAVTMGHIQRKHLTEALCVAPEKSGIDSFDSLFSSLLAQEIELRIVSRSLSFLRDTLLPKLLSGELCIDTLSETIEESA
ncbi:restriction endonuclease subunit S [Desulfuromonas acetoxidans]|uniref:Restriction modification system DNA specificity domain n=1 Tax=Desulfuromonas acetoxidans (strain DSM 684 / 11070) TaxID=281689 RepID=Q1K1M7_DESA6|nr:restriction endonuclease subunit S [Desulfuromonas acetoxidans]EAT16361.1 restriction modification system DNA specificity domain [Desulfuromonas acetoxidans DSM 684]MBF0646989.1 restriction endonuclease subunit S [Desulfuromonas acetoxidans]NVD23501.1 restriction endonuclease subunit S [Desulfuromonas acetoxidans]NVE16113.1 restriction endonuclease subunit S [Desulfuromonas acetoxidans]